MDEWKAATDSGGIIKDYACSPAQVGWLTLKTIFGDEHISLTTSRIGSLIHINRSKNLRLTHTLLSIPEPAMFVFPSY